MGETKREACPVCGRMIAVKEVVRGQVVVRRSIRWHTRLGGQKCPGAGFRSYP